uniref:acyl carrier protein n=1 Tax=Streptomyces sp. DG1A-41 TaxID=3125779 RepID=UPI00403FFBE8
MPASDLDEHRSLRELGLDSLMASQLRQRLRRGHGIDITARPPGHGERRGPAREPDPVRRADRP